MYEFPECGSDEDDDFKEQDRELKASIPFAVVGSNTTLEVAGCKVRGRQYPWGVVDGTFVEINLFVIFHINEFFSSGKSKAQRFYKTSNNADLYAHAGSKRCY